ncbi:MAG: hypothetical protein R3C53_00795 [Pirellulaceae bacterium]
MSSQTAPEIEQIRQQLLSEAQRLADAARSTAWWRGVVIWISVCVVTLAALLLVDCLLRREELGLRIGSLMLLLSVIVASAYKILSPTRKFALTPLELAAVDRTFATRLGTPLVDSD